MSAQEFEVGQSISGTDYDKLPVGAKFRRGPQYSEYEVTETGFKLGMADTTLTAADYRSARRITYLPAAIAPEDKDDLYVEPEPLKEGDWVQVWAQVKRADYESEVHTLKVICSSHGGEDLGIADDPGVIVRPDAGQVPPWVKPVSAAEAPYIEHGWSGCAGSAWENLPSGTRKGWEVAAEYAARITEGGAS